MNAIDGQNMLELDTIGIWVIDKDEIQVWKSCDVVENPEIIGVSKEYVKDETKRYKYFADILKCAQMKDSDPENIYLNV